MIDRKIFFCCFETIVCCCFFYCWTDVIDIVICFKMFASCVFVLIVHRSRLVHRIRFLNDDMKLFLSFLSSFFQMSKKTTSLVQVENYISWLTNQTPGVFILKSIEFYFSQKWSCRMTIYREIYWTFHHKQVALHARPALEERKNTF